MVLADSTFLNLSYNDLVRALKPKVDGSRYLDELFSDTSLDFFIMFSSLAGVIGNLGQTAYIAANAFQIGLIAERKGRGLMGSVMNIAILVGMGYVARRDDLINRLETLRYGNMYERDLHQYFTEAIMAGRPESGFSRDISGGLQDIDPKRDTTVPVWVRNPKFSHHLVDRGSGAAVQGAGNSTVDVRLQLKDAETLSDAQKILEGNPRLRQMLETLLTCDQTPYSLSCDINCTYLLVRTLLPIRQ